MESCARVADLRSALHALPAFNVSTMLRADAASHARSQTVRDALCAGLPLQLAGVVASLPWEQVLLCGARIVGAVHMPDGRWVTMRTHAVDLDHVLEQLGVCFAEPYTPRTPEQSPVPRSESPPELRRQSEAPCDLDALLDAPCRARRRLQF
jgi:hypothetical protein